MPPKPSFRVKLSEQKENAPQLSITTSFALLGTSAEKKLQRKSQRESSFKSSHIQKTRLATWDLNIRTNDLPDQTTTFVNGMPTPLTPSYTMEAEEHGERSSRAAWDETLPLTPTDSICPLASPISLSRIPLKPPTPLESDAAEALLGLLSPRINNFGLRQDHDMFIDTEIRARARISTDTPLSPLLIPGEDLPSLFGHADHLNCCSYDQTETEVHVPRLRKGQTSKVETMLTALEGLRGARISVMDLVHFILNGESSEFYAHRLAFMGDRVRIRQILDIFWEDKKSHSTMESWVMDVGVNHICKVVGNEMESAKPVRSCISRGTIVDPVTVQQIIATR